MLGLAGLTRLSDGRSLRSLSTNVKNTAQSSDSAREYRVKSLLIIVVLLYPNLTTPWNAPRSDYDSCLGLSSVQLSAVLNAEIVETAWMREELLVSQGDHGVDADGLARGNVGGG
jgi:hypothetical protein